MGDWSSYLPFLKSYSGEALSHGGIFGKDGSSWTKTGTVCPDGEEAKKLCNIIASDGTDRTNAQTGGVFLGHEKFKFTRLDEHNEALHFVQKKDDSNKQLNGVAALTKSGVVICICEEDGKTSHAGDGAIKMAEYLKSLNY